MSRLAVVCLLACVPVVRMRADGPSFEVATIKLDNNCGRGGVPGGTSPGRLDLQCVSLRGLIRGAYGGFVGENINSRRLDVLGGPGWLDSDRYDISAKAEGNASGAQMMGPMLQRLLEERFKVKVHLEPRDTPVYALTLAKNGLKLQPSKDGSCAPMDLNNLKSRVPQPGEPTPRYCGGGGGRRGADGKWTADWYGVTMAEFAGRMVATEVDRPVLDKTGLTGRYDVHLEYTRDASPSGPVLLNGAPAPPTAAASDTSGPSIFTALQEQLGLKLVPERSPLDVIVVDRAEKPSEN